MSINEQGTFQIDFESLIKVLGTNLYANPKSAIRELIQNSSDACTRRLAQEQQFEPRIRISTDVVGRKIIIEDNGAGMLKEEVVQHLATIGSGKTRYERQRLTNENPQAAKMLIGQFGIGFLSTFVIANQVIVETRAYDLDIPVHWMCEGTVEYEIGRGERDVPGTQVTLLLKPEHFDLLEIDILRSAIIKYADFIAYPIYLNDEIQPCNHMRAPWHFDASEVEYTKFIERRYNIVPLALKPISIHENNLDVDGVIFIPPQSDDFKGELRSTDLFQKRMYVVEDKHLLPDWAGFICGVIDSFTIELVASRDSVITERESYVILQDRLFQEATNFIKYLAEFERPIFLEVIRHHLWKVLHGAYRNDEFFDQVKDLIPLPSDMGPLTIPKYLEHIPSLTDNTKNIYFIPGEQFLGQQQATLFKIQGIPIIKADQVVERFLKKYCLRVENITLRELKSGVRDLMKPVEGENWRTLEARYQELGIIANALEFDPPEMVSMAIRHKDYDQAQLLERLIGGRNSISDFIAHAGKELSDAYELALNVSNPIIQRLAGYASDPTVFATALRAIYASALLSSGVELSSELSQSVFRAQMRIVELLLEQSVRIETGQIVGPYDISQFELAQNNETGERLLELAVAQYKAGNIGRAETLLLKATEINFENRDTALISLGAIYIQQGRFADAESNLQAAIDNRPNNNIDAYVTLAKAYEAQQLWEKALSLHQKIGGLAPEWKISSQINIGRCLNKIGQNENATKLITNLHLENPQDVHILLALAQLYEEQEKWSDALEAYGSASSLNSSIDVKAKMEDLQIHLSKTSEINLAFKNAKAAVLRLLKLIIGPSRTTI